MEQTGRNAHPVHINTVEGCCPLLSLDQGNIYLSKNEINFRDIAKLKEEYEKLYQEALILKGNPDSEDYKENKRLRQVNLDRRIELLWR